MEGVEDIPGAALARRPALGLGELPRLPRRARASPARRRLRGAGAARRGAALRHGRSRCRTASRRRPTRSSQWVASRPRPSRPARSGFTTSRTLNHRTSTGDPTPTLTAARDELVGIAKAIGDTGKGVLQVVSDFIDFDDEIGTLRAMVEHRTVRCRSRWPRLRATRSPTAASSTRSPSRTPTGSRCERRSRRGRSASSSACRVR